MAMTALCLLSLHFLVNDVVLVLVNSKGTISYVTIPGCATNHHKSSVSPFHLVVRNVHSNLYMCQSLLHLCVTPQGRAQQEGMCSSHKTGNANATEEHATDHNRTYK
jgi:hypothetical protein